MKTFVGSSALEISSAVPATMGQEPAADARRQMMLSGPIAATLLQFAAPTIVVVTVAAGWPCISSEPDCLACRG